MEKQELLSERLRLRPLTTEELSLIMDHLDDLPMEEGTVTDSTRQAMGRKIEKMQNVDPRCLPWYTYWLIMKRESGRGIGVIGMKGLPDENGLSEVGYSIAPDFRRKGLMTEALNLLLGWAFQCPACKGIFAEVLRTNVASQKVLQNCGFVPEAALGQKDRYLLRNR